MEDPKLIVEKLNTILLVDWPSRDIPLALVRAGFAVFSYSPDGYKQALNETDQHGKPHSKPSPDDDSRITERIIFRTMDRPPVAVDLVTIYRPPEEHAAIIRDHVIPLGAKTVWLQPPVESAETQRLVNEHGLNFVQGHDIREIIH